MAITAPATSVNLMSTHIHPAAKPAFDFFYNLERREPTVREQFNGSIKDFMTPNEATPVCVFHGINAHQYAKFSTGYALFQLEDINSYTDTAISVSAWRDVVMHLRWADMEHYTPDTLPPLIHDACPQDILNEAFIGGVNAALIRLMTGQLGRPTTYA